MTALIGGKSIQDIIANMEIERASAADKAKAQRVDLMEKFLKAGISKVFISFAGSGDSGSIDSIEVTWRESGTVELYDGELHDEIDAWAYLYLEGTNVDWYNNDGGQGEITFDLTTVPYSFEATVDINYTSTETAHSEQGVI